MFFGVPSVTLVTEHDVLGFQVPVDDAVGVEVAQGQDDLSQVETKHGHSLKAMT